VPKGPLPPNLREFLSQPNPAVIATVAPDGSPHTAATWYLMEDGRVLVNMDETRRRLGHIRRDPRVSITVTGKGDDWYHQVTLRGRVTAMEEDPELEGADRLSRHYMGDDYARRDQNRVNAWIEVDSWYGWARGVPWTGSE
jgi:PPOX class probable F420-dependent enzyme